VTRCSGYVEAALGYRTVSRKHSAATVLCVAPIAQIRQGYARCLAAARKRQLFASPTQLRQPRAQRKKTAYSSLLLHRCQIPLRCCSITAVSAPLRGHPWLTLSLCRRGSQQRHFRCPSETRSTSMQVASSCCCDP
jgi:hypothetical protein